MQKKEFSENLTYELFICGLTSTGGLIARRDRLRKRMTKEWQLHGTLEALQHGQPNYATS
jgi:hypothetical protein